MRVSRIRSWFAATAAATMIATSVPMAAFAAPTAQRPDARADQRDDHRRFGDHDRQVVHDWYNVHRRTPPAGWRSGDRFQTRVEVGRVLDRNERRRVYSVPVDLLRRLPPAPRGDHYYLVDGQLCLVDGGFQVRDTIRIDGW
jgi:Ni/Co efflux regulator RcnB